MVKILEVFSGYGTASFALKRIGMDYELVGYSDIDKYANQCFKQNHCPDDVGDKLRLGDVTKINPHNLEDFDLLTGGFPCQAFSNAGKMKGELDPRGTLFNEIIRIAEVKQPKYMLLENVKGFTFKKFKDTFDKVLSELDRIGYVVYWKVLNSKDFGVPQNRERVWFVCFRKDVEHSFEFPKEKELKIVLKDLLEKEVDKKYYLSEKAIRGIMKSNYQERKPQLNDVCSALKVGGDVKCIETTIPHNYTKSGYETNDSRPEIGQANRIYGINGVVPPINTGWTPKIETVIPHNYLDKRIYGVNGCSSNVKILQNKAIMVGNLSRYTMKYPRNPYSKTDGVSWRVDTKNGNGVSQDGVTIRRLTPKECFRLMGFLNDEINLDGLSDTQRYKLAGNGQDVNIVSILLNLMLKTEKYL